MQKSYLMSFLILFLCNMVPTSSASVAGWDKLVINADNAANSKNYAEAEKLYLASIKLAALSLDHHDDRYLELIRKLVDVYYAQGKLKEAVPFVAMLVSEQERKYGRQSPLVKQSRTNYNKLLAAVNMKQPNPDSATDGTRGHASESEDTDEINRICEVTRSLVRKRLGFSINPIFPMSQSYYDIREFEDGDYLVSSYFHHSNQGGMVKCTFTLRIRQGETAWSLVAFTMNCGEPKGGSDASAISTTTISTTISTAISKVIMMSATDRDMINNPTIIKHSYVSGYNDNPDNTLYSKTPIYKTATSSGSSYDDLGYVKDVLELANSGKIPMVEVKSILSAIESNGALVQFENGYIIKISSPLQVHKWSPSTHVKISKSSYPTISNGSGDSISGELIGR